MGEAKNPHFVRSGKVLRFTHPKSQARDKQEQEYT